MKQWIGKNLNEEFELWEEYYRRIIRHDTRTDFVGWGNIPNELTKIDVFTREHDLVFSIHLNEEEITHLCKLAKSEGLGDSLTNEQFLRTFLCGPWSDYDTVYLSDETKVKKALPHLIWELSINYPDMSPNELEKRFSISNFRIGLG